MERSGQWSSRASLIEEVRKAGGSKVVSEVVDAFMRGVEATRGEDRFGIEEDDAFGRTPVDETSKAIADQEIDMAD
jgi:hypothetical protein